MMKWLMTAFMAAIVVLTVPVQASALTVEEARHLLARTGFAAPINEVETILQLNREQAVARLLGAYQEVATTSPPAFVADGWVNPRTIVRSNEAERMALRRARVAQAGDLKAWWYREMAATAAPLTEVMTLFWHNHFTSSIRKTRSPVSMYHQNVLLRRHGLGNFADMLRAVARDPAMLAYLDTVRSRADAPNENFARELLELFTLGVGNYSEDDIKNVARAFTGYSVDPQTGTFLFRPRIHDGGRKTVLGQIGAFDGDNIIEILLAHPRTAETVVEKLWRQFISETPDLNEVERLANIFRGANYEIEPLMQALLTSGAFWAEENRANLIKSPVDLLVGTVRQFDINLPQMRLLVLVGGQLGQDIFDPPNVKGWPGGTAWITSETLLLRNDVVRSVAGFEAENEPVRGRVTNSDISPGERREIALARGMQNIGARTGPFLDRWVNGLMPRWEDPQSLSALILASSPAEAAVTGMGVNSAFIGQLITDPVYQLK